MVRLSTLAFAAAVLSGQSLVAGLATSDIPTDAPVSALLASAQAHLSKGQTSDALLYYNAAIARDPSNYLTFFKRATTYLSMGRTSQATDDFNKVLSLKPGFEGAHTQLGRIKARGADWDAAKEQFLLAKMEPTSEEISGLEEAQGAANLAVAAEKSGNWEECMNNADAAIQVASRSLPLRELRSRCRFEDGKIQGGISDLLHVLQMNPGDTSPHVKIAAIQFYAMGDRTEGLAQIRKCLHSDPDSKLCKRLLKEMKATDKVLQKAEKELREKQPMTAVRKLVAYKDEEGLIKEVKTQAQAFRDDNTIPASAGNALVAKLVEMACEAYYSMDSKKAKEHCEESLQLDENSFYGQLYQAKLQLEAEDYEASIRTLQAAAEAHGDKEEIVRPLLRNAELELRRSKTKDYYKVLGVARDSDERQIKAAYRKLMKQHHPDKAVKTGITKEEAEKKMASINEAYEVLSSPELRERFDRGDDPNSQEQHNPFQGSPFGQGGRPVMFQQGSGGQQFQFQFGGGFPF